MRTCKDFLDLGLTELTRRGPILQYRNATSFRDFLRIQDESSSRVHLIRSLWLVLPDYTYQWGTLRYQHMLEIIQQCSHLRRLRIDKWPVGFAAEHIDSFVYTVASHAPVLEDLTIPQSTRRDDQHLSELMQLPLRRLVLYAHSCISNLHTWGFLIRATKFLPETMVAGLRNLYCLELAVRRRRWTCSGNARCWSRGIVCHECAHATTAQCTSRTLKSRTR